MIQKIVASKKFRKSCTLIERRLLLPQRGLTRIRVGATCSAERILPMPLSAGSTLHAVARDADRPEGWGSSSSAGRSSRQQPNLYPPPLGLVRDISPNATSVTCLGGKRHQLVTRLLHFIDDVVARRGSRDDLLHLRKGGPGPPSYICVLNRIRRSSAPLNETAKSPRSRKSPHASRPDTGRGPVCSPIFSFIRARRRMA